MLQPPVDLERGIVQSSLPVSQWNVLHAFDGAAACEKMRDDDESRLAARKEPAETAARRALDDAITAQRCVPADYVYPARK